MQNLGRCETLLFRKRVCTVASDVYVEDAVNMDIDTIKTSCLERWQNQDDRTKYFEEHLSNSIEHMSSEMQELFLEFLSRFDYYSHRNTNSYLTELHSIIMETEGVDTGNSIFSVLKSQKKNLNSSYEYLLEYKLMNDLSKYSCIPELTDLEEEDLENISNIVLIDDFCGSGKTFIDFVDEYKEIIRNRRIIYAVIHCMEKAWDAIREYADKEKLDIQVISIHQEKAAFEQNEKLCDKREVFSQESAKLDLKKDTEVYGFDLTEALVAFYNDTPNNTLGVFWKDTEHNIAVFPRAKNQKPGWMKMAERKRRQKQQNYEKGKNKEDG